MKKSELALSLFQNEADKHNCAQAVVCAFCEDYGVSRAHARRLAARFGRGMGLGSTCGTVSGALMVLGLADTEPALAGKFTGRFSSAAGALRCPDLLVRARDAGEPQGVHCARMVALSCDLLEELLG